jgi:hypothetical protein
LRPTLLLALLLFLFPTPAAAQIFLGSRSSPNLQIGPLFIQATVRPDDLDVPVDVIFSTVIPPTASALEVGQDLHLLWPGALSRIGRVGRPDPRLAQEVESKGLAVIDEGRLPLFARPQFEASDALAPVGSGAPFVTFVSTGGPFGLSAPATYIRIPWAPRLANRAWLVNLRLVAEGLARPKPESWVARTFHGPRATLTLAFNDVGPPAMFAMYFWQRDRVVPVTDPVRLVVNLRQADILAIDEVSPARAQREVSGALENTQSVSVILSRFEGLTPQSLSVRYGYVSGLQAWSAVWVPVAFFALGNLAAVLARLLAQQLANRLGGRVLLGRLRGTRQVRESGVIVPADRLAAIVPGQTTRAQVQALCGPESEVLEAREVPDRLRLVYRGRREIPRRRWSLGILTAVDHWDVEAHEVEVTVDRGVVQDVQARVRRVQAPRPVGPE